jgi:hypothetical protein
MKRNALPKPDDGDRGGDDPIVEYAQSQPPAFRTICEILRGLICAGIPKATCKMWHGSPVWFIDENPVVGYSVRAEAVNLLFWNGQALDEPDLKPVGKHGAAQTTFREATAIDQEVLRRWLKKAKADVLDSKAYFKKLRAAKQPFQNGDATLES